jgi:hypothetical protein
MNGRRITDVFQTDSPAAILSEVIEILHLVSPNFQTDSIRLSFNAVNDLYVGQFPGYRACNTRYHDLSHANATFLAMARLINGALLDGMVFSEGDVITGLTAAILHDVGYIQDAQDRTGTGAKYKAIHEQRSMDFLSRHGKEFGLSPDEIHAGRSIISCTDMDEDISSIVFPSLQIEMLGKLLASADLLAQLSNQTYLEQLLYLHYEFREAGIGNYKSESDILQKALPFFEVFEDRLDLEMNEADRFMKLHFASLSNISENLYRRAISGHKNYLVRILGTGGADPRNQLRRGGIVEIVRCQYRNPGWKDHE